MPAKKKDLQQLARAYTESAVKTLAGIMKQPKAPPAARVKAAEVLLNRGWGMPKQKVEGEITVNAWQDVIAAASKQFDAQDDDHSVH